MLEEDNFNLGILLGILYPFINWFFYFILKAIFSFIIVDPNLIRKIITCIPIVIFILIYLYLTIRRKREMRKGFLVGIILISFILIGATCFGLFL